MFVYTLTPDDKYSLLNRDNLTQPIRTQLSLKQKAFSQFFLAFSKSTLNFEHFQKKMTLIADLFMKLRTPKNVAGYMHRQQGKRVQTLLQSGQQHCYHIY